jgi:type II secretory pathway pseudopilin PulG
MLHRMIERLEARDSERGDTLLEVIIAVAILAIAGVALIGSVLTSITSSSQHRTMTQSDTYLKSYANAAAQQIQRQTNPLYKPCASSYAVTTPADIPNTYTIGIASIQYWQGGNNGSWGGSCSQGNDPAQLITVAVTSPTQGTESLSFAVRNPV